jgi:glucosamine--fructose-6-phosphate aminotransferase (isomerizing)
MNLFLKDILEQPEQLLTSLEYSMNGGSGAIIKAAVLISRANHVFLVGIGASWNAGIAIQAAFNETGVQAILCNAADFLHFTQIPPGAVVIFLSRSGRSMELVKAIPKCREANAIIITITNAPESPLGLGADVCLRTSIRFDHNISVSTYTATILTGILLTRFFKLQFNNRAYYNNIIASLQKMHANLTQCKEALDASSWPDPLYHTYFFARGANLASAHEGMQMWEDVAQHPAGVLSTGAFRYSPREIINHPLNVAIWLDNRIAREHDIELVHNLVERGVNVLTIGQYLPQNLKGYVVEIPECPRPFRPVINIIPIQLAAVKLASMKGVDPDNSYYRNFNIPPDGEII